MTLETTPLALCKMQIYRVETGTPVKKCTSYKYLPPCTLQCRSVDITVNHGKSVFTFCHCTWSGSVIKCKQYSGIIVESGTPLKTVKNTLNMNGVALQIYSKGRAKLAILSNYRHPCIFCIALQPRQK